MTDDSGERETTWRREGALLAEGRAQVGAEQSGLMWRVGDWVLAGESDVFARYKASKVRDLAAEITGYSRHTVAMAASVARKMPPSIRIEAVTWWHHLVVAKLAREQQLEWLTRTAREGWSVKALREQLSAAGQIDSRVAVARTRTLVAQLIQLRAGDIPDELYTQLAAWWDRELAARRPDQAAHRMSA